MKRSIQGTYQTSETAGEVVKAFIPSFLPPKPPIEWSAELHNKFDEALLALGRLDSVSILLPDTSLFLYMYVRKEAVLSSQIEGTQSSLSDLLLFELETEPGVPVDDVTEVSNYVAALNYGLAQIQDGFPITLRLMKEMHRILLSKGRGSKKEPGEFRRSQNWIGGTRPGNAVFVPPPATHVLECMGKLEEYLNNIPEKTPTLLKAALAHVQFETIHPFLDGNGRICRLLIPLLLCSEKILKQPMLYISLYLKKNRSRYYELLTDVRQTGDWESWLIFFAEAVVETASQAVQTAQSLIQLSDNDAAIINSFGRSAGSCHRVHRALLERPIASPTWLATKTTLTVATINACLRDLEKVKIVSEVSGKKRNRIFSYTNYVQLISEGTELLK